jgi:GMP synthase (glutamine-hydrolysing)
VLEARAGEGGEHGQGAGSGSLAERQPIKQPVLMIMHQEHSNPGHIGQWFQRNGYPIDIRKPRFGEPLPATLAEHCGAVVFGGPMSANDKDAFITAETRWIDVALKEKRPFLGICLGAQMLTNHLGGRVGFHRDGLVEVGYYPLTTTPDAGPCGPFPSHVYQWHREGCELWRGARLLATSEGAFANQAFAYGTAVGLQFHAEITYAQIHRWTGRSQRRLEMKGARPRHQHLAGHIAHGPEVRAWIDRFLASWARAELAIA